jgi:hypothetical protein
MNHVVQYKAMRIKISYINLIFDTYFIWIQIFFIFEIINKVDDHPEISELLKK